MGLISPENIAQFEEVGYFVTEPQWSDRELQEMAVEFDKLHGAFVSEAVEKENDPSEMEIKRWRPFVGQIHTKSELCDRWVRSPIYIEACLKLIGPDADLYYNQAVIKPPKMGKSFLWHQDSGYVETKPLEYITCWTAISKTFVENGCIWVIPGSQKWGLLPHEYSEETYSKNAQFDDESGAIPVEMEAGQVAIFSSLLLHKSGANTSDVPRHGYVPQYHAPSVIGVESGELCGDLIPILRDWKPVK